MGPSSEPVSTNVTPNASPPSVDQTIQAHRTGPLKRCANPNATPMAALELAATTGGKLSHGAGWWRGERPHNPHESPAPAAKTTAYPTESRMTRLRSAMGAIANAGRIAKRRRLIARELLPW